MSTVTLKTAAQVTVTTSGTEVRAFTAPAPDRVVKVFFSVPTANTGVIIVGDASVSTTVGRIVEKLTTFELCAQDGQYINTADIWVDAATSGDKVNISYLQMN